MVLALANRELVTLNLLPEGMARVMPVSVQLPLFVVILLSVVVGMVLGYLFEWLREHKHRRARRAEGARGGAAEPRGRPAAQGRPARPEDDVLALLGS